MATVTVYDIAERCGVSASTVSYVLSGQGAKRRIAAATQERVRLTAEEMGYRRIRTAPLPTALSASANPPTISVYWPQRDFEMCMPSLTSGLNTALSAELSPINLSIHPYDQGQLSAQESIWEDSSSDAVLIVAGSSEDLEYLREHPVPKPAVLLNRDLPGYSSVTVDHLEAGRLAAVHAMRCGKENISLVLNPNAPYSLVSRGQRIIEICQENHVDLRNRLYYCENRIDDGYELGWVLVRKNKLSKVIICAYDMVGLGIISALNEAGIHVGADVQVLTISTGPQRLFARSYPPMTVVDLRLEEVTERALSVAIGLATKRLTPPQKLVIQPTIVYRQSCPIPETAIL